MSKFAISWKPSPIEEVNSISLSSHIVAILAINPLLDEISCIIYADIGIQTSTLAKNLDTASTFPRHILHLIDIYDIDEIWCIVWPGAFTLMRIVTLTCNTLAISRHIRLKWLHFFDMIPRIYTPLIVANPRECIIRTGGCDTIIPNTDIPKGIYSGIFTTKEFTEDESFIQYSESPEHIYKIFSSVPYTEKLSPIYFKSPHITWWNKNTSPSWETEKNS